MATLLRVRSDAPSITSAEMESGSMVDEHVSVFCVGSVPTAGAKGHTTGSRSGKSSSKVRATLMSRVHRGLEVNVGAVDASTKE